METGKDLKSDNWGVLSDKKKLQLDIHFVQYT